MILVWVEEMERRLAAIFAADMVGYSRLIEADETETLQRQKRHRAELIDPLIEQHNGNIIKLTGDGMIAEFASVVDAVQCAVSIQREMETREEDVPEGRKIQYRVGINLGDVIFDDGDVYGDGVNIAARLEGLAEPGGVIVSGTAFDHLKSNVPVGYEDLGEQSVKNIATPVRAYRVVPDASGVTLRRPRPRRSLVFATGAVVALIVGLAGWWFTRSDVVPADPARLAYPLPDKPSVAVLPFENMTSDEDNRYLADGFVESLITDLSRLPDLFVIARNSSFAFRDRTLPVGQISEALGVRYIVEGSFQRRGNDLRVSVQLIDAIKGNHVWSARYDRPAVEFLMLQDELVADLTKEIGGRNFGGIFQAERNRVEKLSNADLSIIELWEKATEAFLKYNPEGNEKNAEIAKEMIDRDPNHPRGYHALGWYHLGRIFLGYSDDPAADIEQCRSLAERAIVLDALDYMGHLLLGYCHANAGRAADAATALRRAYELNPHDVLVQAQYAKQTLVREGRLDEALDVLKGILRLSPGQKIGVSSDAAMIMFAMGDYSSAVELGEAETHGSIAYKVRMAAAYWMNDQHENAKKEVSEVLAVSPGYSISSALSFGTWLPKEAKAILVNALISAGMPE